ncbi:hypothetical protein HK104_001371 [Borealophlyctis nickersoniae]|nr:hypothetical protein HK104_001371 [Borealophlyctis nickersoniae]
MDQYTSAYFQIPNVCSIRLSTFSKKFSQYWSSNNLKTSTGAAAAIALVSSVGNLGSVVASYALYKNDGPEYTMSHAVGAGGMAVTAIVAIMLRFVYARANARMGVDAESGKKPAQYVL